MLCKAIASVTHGYCIKYILHIQMVMREHYITVKRHQHQRKSIVINITQSCYITSEETIIIQLLWNLKYLVTILPNNVKRMSNNVNLFSLHTCRNNYTPNTEFC